PTATTQRRLRKRVAPIRPPSSYPLGESRGHAAGQIHLCFQRGQPCPRGRRGVCRRAGPSSRSLPSPGLSAPSALLPDDHASVPPQYRPAEDLHWRSLERGPVPRAPDHAHRRNALLSELQSEKPAQRQSGGLGGTEPGEAAVAASGLCGGLVTVPAFTFAIDPRTTLTARSGLMTPSEFRRSWICSSGETSP